MRSETGTAAPVKDYDTYLADLKEKVKNAEKKLQKSCEKVSDIRKNMQKNWLLQ